MGKRNRLLKMLSNPNKPEEFQIKKCMINLNKSTSFVSYQVYRIAGKNLCAIDRTGKTKYSFGFNKAGYACYSSRKDAEKLIEELCQE
jgi:hypothetical protein